MSGPSEPPGRCRDRTIAVIASISIGLLGGSVLVGWRLHLEALKTIIPRSIPIEPNLAAGMLLCGLALALLSRRKPAKPIRLCAATIAATVIVLAALTLAEYFFGWNLAIDQWLFGGHPGAIATSHPGRMSPASALCFLLVGSALLTASDPIRTRLRISLAGGLSTTLIVIGATTLASFFLEMRFGPRWNFMGMSISGIPGAVAFLCLGIGLLALLHSESGLTWSLDRVTTAGFAVGCLLITLVTALTYNFTLKSYQAAGQVTHAQEVLRALEEIEANVSDLERDQRGYIITGNERLLEQSEVKDFAVREQVGKLQKLAADNSHQQPLLRQFTTLLWQRIGWANQTIEARRKRGFSAAQEMVASGVGARLLDESRRVVQQVEDVEYARLHERQTQSDVASQTAFLMLPLALFLCFAILSLGLCFLNAGLGERTKAEYSLRQSEERMRAVLDSALDCIITMDHHGRVVEFNPAAEKTFGYGRDQAIGQLLSELIIPPSLRERHQKGLSHYLATGEAPVLGKRIELTAMRGGGSEFPIELAITRIGAQEPPLFTGFIRDITERKRAEWQSSIQYAISRVLAESPTLKQASAGILQTVCENLNWEMGEFYAVDRRAGVMRFDDMWSAPDAQIEAFIALSRQTTFVRGIGLPGRVWASGKPIWVPDVAVDENFPRAAAAKQVGLHGAFCFPILTGNEVSGVVEFFSREIRQPDEELLRMFAVLGSQLGEFFERKRAEEALRESEEKFRQLAGNVTDVFWMTSPDMQTMDYINPAYEQIWGRSAESLYANPQQWAEAILPEERERVYATFSALAAGESSANAEFPIARPDGTVRWIFSRGFQVRDAAGKVIRITGIASDITERKRSEDALRASEAHLQTVVENLHEGVVVSDLNGKLLHWNRAALKIHGIANLDEGRRALTELGDNFQLSTMDGTPIPVNEWPLSRILRGENLRDLELRVRDTKAGWQRIFNYGGTLVQDANNQSLLAIVTIRDITERKRAEERLLEQADIINRAPDAIIIRNFESEEITFWNKGAEHLYGWSTEEALGKPLGQLIFADAKHRETPLKQLVSTGEFHGETKQIAKDGREIIVESRARLIRGGNGDLRSVLLINTDVTEQKKLETHLLRAQRLESIGTLASGVAHDLNNILTPILMCAEVLKGNPAAEDIPPTISLIEESARRGAAVVKQVLTFARGIEGERVTIKPGHLIEEMLDIARKTFPKSIEITSRYPEDLATVDCDPTQLHQVLLNLSVNARDAMPSGGRLSITAENFDVDEHYAAMTPGAKIGPHIMLRVSDTGTGMSQANIDKIFDPFFTTKEVGKGTGLGLSTALGIIKSHGGFIAVYSELGTGTTFKVFLPARVNAETLQKSKVPSDLLAGKGELILVVDDEPGILRVNKMILEKHHYRVLTANDGPEALALIAQQKDVIRVVLSDISMPYMDGIMLIRAIRKMKPATVFVASTGQGEETHVAELESLGVSNFLTKPYDTKKLLETVRDTLAASQPISLNEPGAENDFDNARSQLLVQ